MPRIRSIKPEFWTSGQVLECEPVTRLLFIGLWNFCDDAGRHPLREKQIKAQVFPADDFDSTSIRRMIDELSSNGLITVYSVDEQSFIQVNGWHHQKIDRKQDPRYPAPDAPNAKPIKTLPEKTFGEHSTNDQRALVPDRKGKEGIGKERIGRDGKLNAPVDFAGAKCDRAEKVNAVFAYWQQVHNHPRAKLDEKRRKTIIARLKDGYSVDDLYLAIDGCKKTPHNQGQNDTGGIFDDIELICRTASQVDRFIKQANGPDLTSMSAQGRQTVNAMNAWLGEHE